MAFYEGYFSFDGIPCTEFGLMLYNIDQYGFNINSPISTDKEIIEVRLSRKYSPLHYGVIDNTPLEFDMTFGVNINLIDKDIFLDRWDVNTISNWLMRHNTYKVLEITAPDMETFRYKCFIKDLEYAENGENPYAFRCRVVCDSPYAYLSPETFKFSSRPNLENKEVSIFNKSSFPGYYKPNMKISILGANNGVRDFKITNKSDGNRVTSFYNIPINMTKPIFVYNDREIIECDGLKNPYKFFNFKFLRLKPGENKLLIEGNGNVEITCEFPVSIGG